MELLASFNWGSSPPIPVYLYYEAQRSGDDMQYKFRVDLGQLWSSDGSVYFGYYIYASFSLDGVDVSGTKQIKSYSPSSWGGTMTGSELGWYTVSNKLSGTTTLTFRLWGGDRDNYYTYALPVDHTHLYTSVVTSPTCLEQGYTTYTCECGDSYIDSYVEALGHDWDDGVVTTMPTYEDTGIKTYTCSRCDTNITELIEKLIASIYIGNGVEFDSYAIYIDNGEEWELYALYIDDGVSFVPYC